MIGRTPQADERSAEVPQSSTVSWRQLAPGSFSLSPEDIKVVYNELPTLRGYEGLQRLGPVAPDELGRLQNEDGSWYAILFQSGLLIVFSPAMVAWRAA